MAVKCGTLIVCFLLLVVVAADHQEAGCSGPTASLIAGDRYSLSFEQFSSSSDYSNDYRAFHAKTNNRNSWCPEQNPPSSPVHWLQIDFGIEVTIEELQIGGDGGLFRYYLRQFTIHYGPNENNLSPILEPNSVNTMVFSRESSPGLRTTTLPQPLTTRVLRIEAVDYQGDVPCVLLEAMGCVHQPEPCGEGVVSLSSNRTLLPISGIMASSENSNVASQVLNPIGSTGWCTDLPDSYIVFNFSQPVIISHMIARGVVEFSLDYREDFDTDYLSYTLLSNVSAEFSTENGEEATHTFWSQPLEGGTFLFFIHNNNGFCWNAELFGCVENNQEVISSTTELISTTVQTTTDLTSTDSTGGPTDDQTTMTTSSPGAAVASTGVIAGATAAGVVAVLIIAVLILLIIICAVLKSRKSKSIKMSEVAYSEAKGVRIVDNEIYGKETPPTSPTSKQAEAEANATYESVKSPTANPVDLNVYAAVGSPNVKPAIDQYEPLASPTYAMVNTPVKVTLTNKDKSTKGSSRDGEFKVGSLTDNAAYGSNLALTMSGEAINFQPDVSTSAHLGNTSHDQANGSHDMDDVNNPMYGAMESRPTVDNPLYNST